MTLIALSRTAASLFALYYGRLSLCSPSSLKCISRPPPRHASVPLLSSPDVHAVVFSFFPARLAADGAEDHAAQSEQSRRDVPVDEERDSRRVGAISGEEHQLRLVNFRA